MSTGGRGYRRQSWASATLSLLLALACGPTGTGTSALETKASDRDANRIETAVESVAAGVLSEERVAGFSIAVGRGGEIAFSRGYGLADVAAGTPAGPQTVYPIGSISKHLTATLVLTLVEDGSLRLEDPIGRWIPDLPATGAGDRIVVRHLLTHTSGLFDIARAAPEELPSGHHDRAALMAMLSRRSAQFEPGTARRYSNTGFHLLGEIASRAADASYFEALRRRVLEPAGARHTTATTSTPRPAKRAVSYREVNGRHERHDRWEALPGPDGYAVPAGFLQSTVEDLVRLGMAIERGHVIGKPLVERMRRPTRLANGIDVLYGLGTRLGAVNGHPKVGHTGGLATYRAALTTYPEDDLTIAVLLNTDLDGDAHHEAATIEYAIAATLLGETASPIAPVATGAGALSRYAGRYRSQDGTTARIELRGMELFVHRDGSSSGPYLPVGPGRFALGDWPATVWHIEFDETADGRTRVLGADSGWQDEWQLVKEGRP